MYAFVVLDFFFVEVRMHWLYVVHVHNLTYANEQPIAVGSFERFVHLQ